MVKNLKRVLSLMLALSMLMMCVICCPVSVYAAESEDQAGTKTAEEIAEFSAEPSAAPSAEPSAEPSAAPSAEPSAEPSAAPSAESTAEPSEAPQNPYEVHDGTRAAYFVMTGKSQNDADINFNCQIYFESTDAAEYWTLPPEDLKIGITVSDGSGNVVFEAEDLPYREDEITGFTRTVSGEMRYMTSYIYDADVTDIHGGETYTGLFTIQLGDQSASGIPIVLETQEPEEDGYEVETETLSVTETNVIARVRIIPEKEISIHSVGISVDGGWFDSHQAAKTVEVTTGEPYEIIIDLQEDGGYGAALLPGTYYASYNTNVVIDGKERSFTNGSVTTEGGPEIDFKISPEGVSDNNVVFHITADTVGGDSSSIDKDFGRNGWTSYDIRIWNPEETDAQGNPKLYIKESAAQQWDESLTWSDSVSWDINLQDTNLYAVAEDGGSTAQFDYADFLKPGVEYSYQISVYLNGKRFASDVRSFEIGSAIVPADGNGLGKDIDGVWRYYQDGKVDWGFTGLAQYEGTRFYIVNGTMDEEYTGLIQDNDTWFYIVNGTVAEDYTGLVKAFGAWFYIENGVLNWDYTGLVKQFGTWFYVENGVINWNCTGLVKDFGTWFYVENGILDWSYTGLVKQFGTWFYVKDSVLNWSYTGLIKDFGTWFYVDRCILNWQFTGITEYNGVLYYVQNSVLKWGYSGTLQYNGNLYSIVNSVAQPIAIGKTTASVNLRSGAGTYYSIKKVVSAGTTVTVLEKTNSKWYKVRLADGTEGYLSSTYVDITQGNVGSITKPEMDTSTLTEAEKKAKDVLDSVGWDLHAAFNWSAKQLPYYTLSYGIAGSNVHSEWYANYGFDNMRGNCYVMAATFYKMAKLLGYDAYFIEGYVRTSSGGKSPHGWCEIVMDGTTYVFDPDFQHEYGRNGYQITYGASGTFQYVDYERVS